MALRQETPKFGLLQNRQTTREKLKMTEESPLKDKGTTPKPLLKDTPTNERPNQQDRNPTGDTDMNPQTVNGKPTQEDKGEWTSLLQLQTS